MFSVHSHFHCCITSKRIRSRAMSANSVSVPGGQKSITGNSGESPMSEVCFRGLGLLNLSVDDHILLQSLCTAIRIYALVSGSSVTALHAFTILLCSSCCHLVFKKCFTCNYFIHLASVSPLFPGMNSFYSNKCSHLMTNWNWQGFVLPASPSTRPHNVPRKRRGQIGERSELQSPARLSPLHTPWGLRFKTLSFDSEITWF